MDASELVSFLKRLRAVRHFKAGAIPNEAREAIFDVARWTGTATNRQAWDIVWVDDPATLKQLGELEGYAKHAGGAAAAAVLVMGDQPEWLEQDIFDEGRLSERIMLAAAAQGVAGCIGWLDGSGVEGARKLLGIPAERRLRTLVSLGYAAPEQPKHRRGGRKPLSELISFGRFGRRTEAG